GRSRRLSRRRRLGSVRGAVGEPMKRSMIVLPALATVGVLAVAQEPSPPAESKQRHIEALSERARKAEFKGDLAEALKAYEEVRAQTTKATEAEFARVNVEATLRSARALEAMVAADKGQ